MKNLFYKCAYEIEYETVGDDVNYAFVEEKDTLYIYFQASSSLTDWVLNFLFKKKLYGMFKVHRGFLHAYSQVRNIVLDKVYSKKYKSVVIVGYSHGGSLTQLALEDIVFHFPNINAYAYAFESPRCLKVPKSKRYLWANLKTIRNNNDLITHLPPKLFGFDDLGTMIKISGDTELVKNRMPKCIKSHYPDCVLDGLHKLEK